MRQSTRLIFNTVVTLCRMVLTVGIGLLLTRWTKRELGDGDFGTIGVIGATGTLLMVLADALTGSAVRHLSFEIGRGDRTKFEETFNTALAIFVGMGAVTLVIGLALMNPILSVLKVPEGREDAAWWVMLIQILTIVVTIAHTPFRAVIQAKQQMVFVAVFELLQQVLRIAAVGSLLFVEDVDKMVLYMWLMLGVTVFQVGSFVVGCVVMHPEARPRAGRVRRKELPRLAAFAGWGVLGSMSWRLRMQGAQVLLNVVFGPVVNSAYTIAVQMASYQGSLKEAIMRPAQPALIANAGAGNMKQVRNLTVVISKYSCLFTTFYLVPIMFETERLLELWLGKGEVPAHTATLVRLVGAWMWVQQLSLGHLLAAQAKDIIGRFTVVVVCFDAAVLVVAGLVFWWFGAGPWAMPATTVVVMLVLNVVSAWQVGRWIELPVGMWARRTVWPAFAVAGACALGAWGVHAAMADSVWRILAVTAAVGLVGVPACWVVGMEAWEREHFMRVALGGMKKVKGRVRKGRDADEGVVPHTDDVR